MYLAGRWADRQLSKLEMVIAVIVLGVVLFVLIQQMLKLFAVAERSFLISSVTNINTALQYRAAGYALTGDFESLMAMQGTNPFAIAGEEPAWLVPGQDTAMPTDLLAGMASMRTPGNYLGELDNPDPADIKGGRWYFDVDNQTLVYRIDNPEFFVSKLTGPPRVEFMVELMYEDRNGNQQFDPQVDEYRSIALKSRNGYVWRL